MYFFCLSTLIILYVLCDVNYFVRTLFICFINLFQSGCNLRDTSAFYSIGTFQDCDLKFKSVRLARIVRELDFARYEYYFRTGVYSRTRELKIHSLQGSTFVVNFTTIPLFVPYKITCKLIYWDDRSLFIEHEVVTLSDGQVRGLMVSRQYAISESGVSTRALLKTLQGFEERECPDYLQKWLDSMKISSDNSRRK